MPKSMLYLQPSRQAVFVVFVVFCGFVVYVVMWLCVSWC